MTNVVAGSVSVRALAGSVVVPEDGDLVHLSPGPPGIHGTIRARAATAWGTVFLRVYFPESHIGEWNAILWQEEAPGVEFAYYARLTPCSTRDRSVYRMETTGYHLVIPRDPLSLRDEWVYNDPHFPREDRGDEPWPTTRADDGDEDVVDDIDETEADAIWLSALAGDGRSLEGYVDGDVEVVVTDEGGGQAPVSPWETPRHASSVPDHFVSPRTPSPRAALLGNPRERPVNPSSSSIGRLRHAFKTLFLPEGSHDDETEPHHDLEAGASDGALIRRARELRQQGTPCPSPSRGRGRQKRRRLDGGERARSMCSTSTASLTGASSSRRRKLCQVGGGTQGEEAGSDLTAASDCCSPQQRSCTCSDRWPDTHHVLGQ